MTKATCSQSLCPAAGPLSLSSLRVKPFCTASAGRQLALQWDPWGGKACEVPASPASSWGLSPAPMAQSGGFKGTGVAPACLAAHAPMAGAPALRPPRRAPD